MATWHELQTGVGCPLCLARRDADATLYRIRQLDSCTLYLVRDQRYRGACRAIFDPRHVNRIDELSLGEWRTLARDLWRAQRALMHTVPSEHINLASLGNEVPHLHWHLIPRRPDDGLWGAPIWRAGAASEAPRLLRETEYAQLAARINAALDQDSDAG